MTSLAAVRAAEAQLRLSRLVGDHMVVQRDVPVPVWGWATPGATITVAVAGRSHEATAGADGAWEVTLPAMPAGGPHVMTVAGDGARQEVRDILVGDVWVASGQSNMEWTVADARDAGREIAAARDAKIRHFKVPQSWAERPEAELAGGAWAVGDSAHVGGFSAVGYFFARDLRRAVDVPIGLLHTSWGGSRIEPWMSAEALGVDSARVAGFMAAERAEQQAQLDALRARLGPLPTEDAGLAPGAGGVPAWADPALDDAAWASIAVPGAWEEAGYPGMDGVAWYRTTFALTAEEARRGVRLTLGTIDDDDVTWVNGREVGRTRGYNLPRTYDVPAAALRAGSNVLAVRVEDGAGGGGIIGPAAALGLEVGGERRALPGPWRFRVGAVTARFDGQRINKVPTVLHNAMVHPALRFPIKGVLWYQGESNANTHAEAVAYAPLFQGLIRDWRARWRSGAPDGAFPFLWVQLANYMPPEAAPLEESAWAAVRESQSQALALPNTAQAVAIDVGEADDIHPRNKQDVGARLALAARRVAYGQDVVHAGPTYRAHAVRDGRVVLSFDHVGGGLVAGRGTPVSKDAARTARREVGGFAVAGADRRWVWARAAIEGDRVVVWSDAVRAPVAVRYAWSHNPAGANLYNRAGLPASPFRTDTW